MQTEEPRLSKEIALSFWRVLKSLVAIAAVFGLLVGLVESLGQIYGLIAFHTILVVAMVIFFGHQSFQWKKDDYRREKERKAQAQQWEEARKRQSESKS